MGKIPFVFNKLNLGAQMNMLLPAKPEIYTSNESPINFTLPKMVYDDCFLLNDNNAGLFRKQQLYKDSAFATVSVKTHFDLFNIFNEAYMYEQIYTQKDGKANKTFSIISLLASSNGWSLSDIAVQAIAQGRNCANYAGGFITGIALLHHFIEKHKRHVYFNVLGS